MLDVNGAPPTGSARVAWEVQGTGWNIAPDTDASTVFFGGKNHELFAVERTTGALRWRVRSPLQTSFTEGMSVAVAGNDNVLTYAVASTALSAGSVVFAAGYERLLALRKD